MLLKSRKNIISILFAFICLSLSFVIISRSFQTYSYYKSQDIYAHFKTSKKILNGKNPYLPILKSDMKQNNKYPTYFAGFYYLIMPTIKLYPDFNIWIHLWQKFIIIFYALVGFLIYYRTKKNSNYFIAITLSLIWLVNRWSIYLATTLSMDTLGIALLLLSLILIDYKQKLALLIFGLQIAIKHLTIFLLPLFLIKTKKNSLKNNFYNLLLILLPVIVVSIQFLLNNPNAYLKSILFTATRISESHFNVLSLTVGQIFQFQGLLERLPILIGISFIYITFLSKKTNFILSIIMILMISITFNPVFFLQYQAWFIAILLFYLSDIKKSFT